MDTNYLSKALSLLERETPLKLRDCGTYCRSICCKGGGLDETVFLFPDEKELFFEQNYKFLQTKANFSYDALVCNGICDRKYRPLGCRIFPLFPLATKIGDTVKISVVFDPRAKRICPLSNNMNIISKSFIKAVKRAGEYLILDKKQQEYLLSLSDELREYANLSYKLGISS